MPTHPMQISPPSVPLPPSRSAARRILLLLAHPDLHASQVSRRLLQAARALQADGPRTDTPALDIRDLYARYPDFDIDVAAEQQAAAAAELIIWLHPIQWYSMPALMKHWLDQVLELGWAYGAGGKALAGKDLWLVLSTGAQAHSYRPEGYNRQPFEVYLAPYRQTAALCGLRLLPPLVLHGARRLDAAQLQAHTRQFEQRLRSYPDWPELAELACCDSVPLPAGDRPLPTETA